MKIMTLAAVAAMMALGACGGSGGGSEIVTEPDDVAVVAGSVAANANGSFTITQGGKTTVLPASNVNINGQKAWRVGFNGGVDSADSFITDEVNAIGGVAGDGTAFSGITGTVSAAPIGDATFIGRYAVTETSGNAQSGPLTLAFDLSANTLDSANGSPFVVDGAVGSNGAVTGTVAYNGDTAAFTGGFYGVSDVAGAFNSDVIGGVFFGTEAQ